MRQAQRAFAEPVILAIDLPARILLLEIHREPMRQRALAEVLFQQKGLLRIELLQRGDELVQFGLHPASDPSPLRSIPLSFRDGAAPNPESRDSQMCDSTSGFTLRVPRNDGRCTSSLRSQ